MAVTVSSLRAAYPEQFDDIADAAISAAIARAERMTPLAVWGDLQDDGVLNLTAHFLTVGGASASLQGASSYTAGPVSVSYGSGGARSTSYLDLYESMRRGLAVRPICP